MNKALSFLGYICLFVVSVILTAFTISTLWLWFVTPLGVKAIGMAHAFGLSTIIMFIKVRGRKDFVEGVLVEKSETRKWTEHFALPIAALLIGYITTLFM